MSLLKCKNALQMPSNISSDIKIKIKKIISDRPTDPNFFQYVTVNTHIFLFGLKGFFS